MPFVPSRRDGGRVAEVAAFSCMVAVVGFLTLCRNGEQFRDQFRSNDLPRAQPEQITTSINGTRLRAAY